MVALNEMPYLMLVITVILLWEVMETTLYLHWRVLHLLCTHNGDIIKDTYFKKSFPTALVSLVFYFLIMDI